MIISTIYFPNFFQTPAEKAIRDKLIAKETLNWDVNKYQALLQLKKHISKITASLHELKAVVGNLDTQSLETLITEALDKTLSDKQFNPASYVKPLTNTFARLKSELEEDKKASKCFGGINMLANSIIATVGGLGVVLFGLSVFTAPLGTALLGLGMMLVSTLVFAITTYSLYVDGRFMADKQLKEIEAGINFLCSYPDGDSLNAQFEDHDHTLFCSFKC
ncbi:hypothetical protein OQJ26_00610 [Legionella sp. PATHC038]|uniref:hypothetical protein n=1 Tax=Legionella sheltonii TaxID=2992041 RepID=UPI0022431F03|nr:hypothetical protein [Legionella sp. PATHC038]MCW8397294.1 hypothetical protein [Legionella sp. PATHC038]